MTTHNLLYLWFRSDNSTAQDGFELSWESIDPGELFFVFWKKIVIANNP